MIKEKLDLDPMDSAPLSTRARAFEGIRFDFVAAKLEVILSLLRFARYKPDTITPSLTFNRLQAQ